MVGKLLELHKNSKHLQRAADDLSITVQELLLQQLQYLAGRLGSMTGLQRSEISSLCCQKFRLHNTNGQSVLASSLHLPPHDAAAVGLLAGLSQAGGGLQLLAADYAEFASDEEQQLVLTKLLGVKQADTAAIIRAIAQLHSSSSAQLSQDQRLCHLAYLARHTNILQENEGLLQLVQQVVLLPSSVGSCHRGSQLFYPLGEQFATLQGDMDAAGMLFLESGFIEYSMEEAKLKRQTVVSLVELLGVRSVNESRVVQHIVKLYTAAQRITSAQHLTHLSFIAANWHNISADVQALVYKSLKLRVQGPVTATAGNSTNASDGGSCPSSNSERDVSITGGNGNNVNDIHWAVPGSLYELPAANRPESQLVMAMQLAGLQFLHPLYESAADGSRTLQWMRNNLGLKLVTPTLAATSILAAIERDSSQYIKLHRWTQLVDHAVYIADICDQMDAQRVKQTLRVGLQPASGSTNIPVWSTATAQSSLYWPSSGKGWQLQQVLLPSKVKYLHPAYAERVQEFESRFETRAQARRLKDLFTRTLGVLDKPVAGSPELQHAIAAGDRWLPLLQLLADRWSGYTPKEQRQLAQQLQQLQVGS